MGASFGRGGATTFQQDLANADVIIIQGSNMAECHPVGFQWVVEAKERGATVIHVDPRSTRTFCYAVGWTQHTVGVQYIRTAAIIQLLLGNIGRPGGGILALRGHASIQGSTDIPTLYDLLPGYVPMPHSGESWDLDSYVENHSSEGGYWANFRDYATSLLKAWWGDHARADNDFCWDYLPRTRRDTRRTTPRWTCWTRR